MKKRIDNTYSHVIVCGYGRNGSQAAHELLNHRETVVIIERDENVAEAIDDTENCIAVTGDATHDDILHYARIGQAKALITTLPSDADNLFVVLTAQNLNPSLTIISRASDDNSEFKLKRAGAKNVIMPDKVGGTRMAKLVSQPDVVEFIESLMLKSEEEVYLEEIDCEELKACYVNKSIGELNIRKESGANLIGLKKADKSYIFNPAPNIRLTSRYKLFALGTSKQIESLKDILTGKDN